MLILPYNRFRAACLLERRWTGSNFVDLAHRPSRLIGQLVATAAATTTIATAPAAVATAAVA